MSAELVLLDPETTGHHREYIMHLGEALTCHEQKTISHFYVHQKIKEELDSKFSSHETLRINAIPSGLLDRPAQIKYVLSQFEGRTIRLFFPRLNSYLKPLLGLTGLVRTDLVTISGIWFGPQCAALVYPGGGLLKKLAGYVELFRLRRLRDKGGLRKLYVLNDSRTAELMTRKLLLKEGVQSLADPLSRTVCSESSENYRKRLGIAPNAKVFGLLGALREGKGVEETLNAFAKWQPDAVVPQVLLIAGQPQPVFVEKFEALVSAWSHTASNVKLVFSCEYIDDEAFRAYVEWCDFILLPYRNAFGSSGLLGHAANAKRPVLSTKNGLLGDLVTQYRLGGVFEATKIHDFCDILDRASAGQISMDAKLADSYLLNNSVAAFVDSIRGGELLCHV